MAKTVPRPAAPNDIRLRKMLDGPLAAPRWPNGFALREFEAEDAPALHALLQASFDDGQDGPFEEWWPRLLHDPEFDPSLCFLVFGADGRLAGSALCWSSAFIRDLAVHPDLRGRGIAEALLWHAFGAFRQRGAAHVDLKTNTVLNAAAVRLYRRVGMVEVAWDGA